MTSSNTIDLQKHLLELDETREGKKDADVDHHGEGKTRTLEVRFGRFDECVFFRGFRIGGNGRVDRSRNGRC